MANIRNDIRLRGIKKGSVNADNFADVVASVYLANVKNTGGIKVASLHDWANALVGLHLRPQMFISLDQLKRTSQQI